MSDTKSTTDNTKPATGNNGSAAQPTLKWDDSSMSTSYANVVNVSMTREECGLFFGTNLTTGIGGAAEVTIKLSDRIIMTPHAAKRLSILLENHLRGYEERYGKLDVQRNPATQ
ncbi:MAG: DUF3467 domain-containing protein [Gammaproteobacteria bacterium]|nr:DUF3467 domain-containing protein [Gammaproteobacteria bacterium]